MLRFLSSAEKLEMLEKGQRIGLGATPFINSLYDNKKITAEQRETFLNQQFPNKSKMIEKNQNNITVLDPRTGKKLTKEGLNVVNATRCKDCGDLLNGGTYGYIFRSIKNPTKIIKGSARGHARAFSCPPDFEKENTMYKKIKNFFPATMETISLLNISKNWVENRRCYLEMDEIRPVVLTKRQMKKALALKFSLPENQKYIIDKLVQNKFLFMLLPGDEDPFRAESGGGETSEWIEIGKGVIDMYFNILGMSSGTYYKEQNTLVDLAIANNILMNDVEFILGTVDGETRVFMIDFDKVEDIAEYDRDNFLEMRMKTIEQPMFPAKKTGKLSGEWNTKTRKKRRRGRNKKTKRAR